jgi:hypothetical protein
MLKTKPENKLIPSAPENKDYEGKIKANAELRVHKEAMFAVEYKNPNAKNWEVHLMYANASSAINLAKEISAVIHKKPIQEFKVIYDNE